MKKLLVFVFALLLCAQAFLVFSLGAKLNENIKRIDTNFVIVAKTLEAQGKAIVSLGYKPDLKKMVPEVKPI